MLLFDKWLKEMTKKYNLILPKCDGNTAFITWSDWDFGVCLDKECERKRFRKPNYFDQWIDLKAIFRVIQLHQVLFYIFLSLKLTVLFFFLIQKWYKYRPTNFSDALGFVNLSFVGREHSGIDDARNIGILALKIANDGALLNITKDLKPFIVNYI